MNTNGLKRLWKTVFGDPDSFIDAFFEIAYSPDRCRYIAEDGEVISALYWFDCEYPGGKLAYIYAVATDPNHRGKGLASRLLRETHVHLKALGYAGAVLKPATGLFPFYERLGYVTSGFVRTFNAEADSTPVVLTELSPAQYADQRRKLLPENGIRQEGLTLEFLHTFARFYKGDNCLVCVARDEPFIFEYLGDPSAAPGILNTLDIPNATIRIPGSETPFAMFYPLNCIKTPGYLGITLE